MIFLNAKLMTLDKFGNVPITFSQNKDILQWQMPIHFGTARMLLLSQVDSKYKYFYIDLDLPN